MPTNKNAQLRYQILDRCFSDFSRKYEIQDLVDIVNDALYDLYGTEVSLRQIREDIKSSLIGCKKRRYPTSDNNAERATPLF